jgi:DNA repair protein RecO (recombination protein O)
MPLRETEAIVLRTYRIGEADKVISLFSRQLGRIRAAATGAQRPKSRFGGLLEPLSYVRLCLFERENRELLRLNSAELLESFFAMQSRDYRVQLAAQYMVEAGERFLPEREVSERAFRLFLTVLRGMQASGEIHLPLLYFDYWMLRLGGFLPPLDRCLACGRSLAGQAARYSTERVGLTCVACHGAPERQSLPAEVIGLLGRVATTRLDVLSAAEGLARMAQQARPALEKWMEISAERKFVSLQMLAEEA